MNFTEYTLVYISHIFQEGVSECLSFVNFTEYTLNCIYGTNKHMCSGRGGEEGSVLRGGNFNLLRHGPRQICPG